MSERHQARFKAWRDSNPKARPFEAKASNNVLELNVLDVIGYDWWTGGGITTKMVKRALDDAGDVGEIRVLLDTPGGDVFDGVGIYNVLRRHPARVVTEVVGLAASAGSIIALAGDEILMHVGTEMMIHKASGMTWGDDEDHDKTATALRSITGSLVDIYVNQTKKDAESIAALVKAETWMSASEAVKEGFATKMLTESGTKNSGRRTAQAGLPSNTSRPVATAGFKPLRGLL